MATRTRTRTRTRCRCLDALRAPSNSSSSNLPHPAAAAAAATQRPRPGRLLVAPLFAMFRAPGQGSGFSDASALARPPDASSLGVTAFNVGMIQEDAFTKMQDSKVAELAGYVERWLEEGPAVVGLNEIHPHIVTKLQHKLKVDVDIAIHESNCLLWRTPQ